MPNRTFLNYIIITLKGLAMGAADVVPGVSGGTIAFISGIYEELLDTINKINISALIILKKEGFKKMWKYINGNFLLALLTGIAISILSLAKVIKWLLENQPVLLWSFFFGLIIASILFVGKQIKQWNIKTIISILAGAAIAYFITIAEPISSPDNNLYLLFCGSIAIIAMILPGISGSFILVLLGAYEIALSTITQLWDATTQLNLDKFIDAFTRFLMFAVGAIIGIKLFSNVLKWMFSNYKNSTLALLTGFMIGSLNKVWPWKETLTWRINSYGKQVPLLEKSISPFNFKEDPQLITAIILAIMGFLTIFALEKLTAKKLV